MITSRQNPLFRRLRDAIRDHAEEIVLEGPKQVSDAIRHGWKPLAVVERGKDFSPEIFDALAETKTPQGVLGLFSRPVTSLADVLARHDTIAVALDSVQDPGNVGTIVRLAAAFDASGVLLLPGCADPYAPKAIRSTAGAILNVPVVQVTASELVASGLPLVYADMHGAPTLPPARNAILVFGSEGAGVSSEIREKGMPIAIAMSGRVESLNVAASAAILLSRSYEARAGMSSRA